MWIRSSCLIFALFLSGCGLSQVQKDSIGQFSRSSASFSETVATQLIDARSTVMDLNVSVLTLAPQRIKDRDKIDGALTPDRISARIRAAETLQSYADLLLALVEDRQEAELAAASAKFKQSVRGLDPDSRKLSEEQLTAVGELVEDIGGLIVEYKKKKAIEAIVPGADAQVQKIADLFASEFNTDGPVAKYVNAMGLLAVTAADSVLDDTKATVQDRIPAVEANRKGVETRRKTDAMYPGLAAAATQLKAGHEDIVKGLGENKITLARLNELTKTVQELAAHTRLMLKH